MRRFIWSVGFLWLALLPLQRLASAVQAPADTPVAPPDPKLFQQLLVLKAHTHAVYAVGFSPDGKKVISGGRDIEDKGGAIRPPNVKIWDASTGQQLLAVRTGQSYDGPIAFSPNGALFVAYANRMYDEARPPINIWDATKGQPLIHLEPSPLCMAFSPDGKSILGCKSKHRLLPDLRVALWDAASGRVARSFSAQLTEPNEYVKVVAFSPDGKKFATLGGKPIQAAPGGGQFAGVPLVRVWDLESGKVTVTKALSFLPLGLAFGPEGKVIVGGHDLNLPPTAWVKVFDATTGQETLSLKTHGIGAAAVCCSSDGKRIVTGNSDGTVRVWDAENGKELAILRGHVNGIHSVAYSPNGTKIASGGSDGTVRIWGIPAGQGNQQPQPK